MKVIIIDDDPIVSSSLKTIIESDNEISVDAIGTDGSEAMGLYKVHKPDIILMDIQMQNMSGLTASKKLIEAYPDTKILLLTTFSDDEYIVQAMKIGVKGYILKQHFESIVPALKSVYLGQNVFGDTIINKISSINSNSNAPKDNLAEHDLSEREKSIIKLIADGLSNKEISEKLYISEGTVRNLVSVILDKLSLKTRTQLAIFYLKKL